MTATINYYHAPFGIWFDLKKPGRDGGLLSIMAIGVVHLEGGGSSEQGSYFGLNSKWARVDRRGGGPRHSRYHGRAVYVLLSNSILDTQAT